MLKRLVLLGLLVIVTISLTGFQEEGSGIPAYNATAPKAGTKLPPILGKEQLWGENNQYAFQGKAYEIAAKIPAVIHQQPCYCYCDRMGHNSLHSCFENTHGAQCATCMKEVFYSYAEHKKGKTAKQIRDGIIKGEWKQVNLETAATMN